MPTVAGAASDALPCGAALSPLRLAADLELEFTVADHVLDAVFDDTLAACAGDRRRCNPRPSGVAATAAETRAPGDLVRGAVRPLR